MDESAVDKVIDALTPLAAKIGEGATHVYALAVRQVIVEAVAGIVGGLGLIALAVIVGRLVFRHLMAIHESASSGPNNYGYYGGFAVGGWISVGVASLISIIGASWLFRAVVSLATPEYAAIRGLLRSVAGS